MSLPTAPDPPTHYKVTHHEALSKVVGAGAGSALVVWASAFGLSPNLTHALEISAPTVAVVIATAGPYFTRFIKYQVRYYGLHYILKRAKRLAISTTPESVSRIQADLTVQNLEIIINDLNNESAGFVNSLWNTDRRDHGVDRFSETQTNDPCAGRPPFLSSGVIDSTAT